MTLALPSILGKSRHTAPSRFPGVSGTPWDAASAGRTGGVGLPRAQPPGKHCRVDCVPPHTSTERDSRSTPCPRFPPVRDSALTDTEHVEQSKNSHDRPGHRAVDGQKKQNIFVQKRKSERLTSGAGARPSHPPAGCHVWSPREDLYYTHS